MRMSTAGRKLIERLEGRVATAYRDSGGQLTIGVGHLITKSERLSGKIIIRGVAVPYRDGLTESEIDGLLDGDLHAAEECVSHETTGLSENESNAMISFVFNVGCQAFAESTLLKKIIAGEKSEVPKQLRRWVYDDGKKVAGLIARRKQEIDTWEGR